VQRMQNVFLVLLRGPFDPTAIWEAMMLTNGKKRVTATLQSAGFVSGLAKTGTNRQISQISNVTKPPRQTEMEAATRT
jgi:hypothetical protein